MKKYDCIVIGAGFAGSVIARILAEEGLQIELLERRPHIAGNMYDEKDKNGILIQKYGPHIFHTNDIHVADFLQRFGEWRDFTLKCSVYMEGKFTPSPFNFQTIDDFYSFDEAQAIKKHIKKAYGSQKQATILELLRHQDEVIRSYAEFLYEKDYSLYTAKQWGIDPSEVDPETLKRVPVLFSYEDAYFNDSVQMLPIHGFTNYFNQLLQHTGIDVKLNTDFKKCYTIDTKRKAVLNMNKEKLLIPVIYTGALDNLLDYRYGELPYRSLNFIYETYHRDLYQDTPVVAYPQEKDFTRITEYKQFLNQNIDGFTTIAKEYPIQYQKQNRQMEPYYPVISSKSLQIYHNYRKDIDEIPAFHICGRLAEYKYYNMDQVVKNAMQLAEKIKGEMK